MNLNHKYKQLAPLVELHQYHVQGALDKVEDTLRLYSQVSNQRPNEVHFDVGQGHHSANHRAVLRPAVEKWFHRNNYQFYLPPQNHGIVCVKLNSKGS